MESRSKGSIQLPHHDSIDAPLCDVSQELRPCRSACKIASGGVVDVLPRLPAPRRDVCSHGVELNLRILILVARRHAGIQSDPNRPWSRLRAHLRLSDNAAAKFASFAISPNLSSTAMRCADRR